jgi:hypothetical protein
MGFWDGLAEAMDSVRHEVEQAAYGREVTNDIQLPQQQEPAVEPTSWQDAAKDIEPSHNDLYCVQQPTQEMER